ncbi:MAG: sirohydrochlorin chelatase [Lachnospirales bacterium]
MKAVLLVAHGSRKTQTNDVFFGILELIRKRMPGTIVDGAFMSFNEMNIEFKLEELIQKGAKEITIVPYFLFSGNHVKNTIPFKVEKILQAYPDVTAVYKESLGIDERLADIIVDRILE